MTLKIMILIMMAMFVTAMLIAGNCKNEKVGNFFSAMVIVLAVCFAIIGFAAFGLSIPINWCGCK